MNSAREITPTATEDHCFNGYDRRIGMRLLQPAKAALTAAVLLGALGCENESASAVTDLNANTAPLAALRFTDWTPWPNAINICFRKQTGVPQSEYTSRKSDVMSALQLTWPVSSALTFANVGDCPTTVPSGTLEINLDFVYPPGDPQEGEDFSNAGFCGYGLGAVCHIGIKYNVAVEATAVHEVGHALGLGHEHPRTDETGTTWEEPLCPGEQAKFDAEIADGGTGGGWLADSTLETLTRYDPLSVMNYCAIENGRGAEEYSLTELDALGIEMLYPRYWSYPYHYDLTVVCHKACFQTGSGLVARSNGSVTLGWTAKGALDLLPGWSTASGSVNAEYLAVSSIGSPDRVVAPFLVDQLGRNHVHISHTQQGERIITSNGKHTAIQAALL